MTFLIGLGLPPPLAHRVATRLGTQTEAALRWVSASSPAVDLHPRPRYASRSPAAPCPADQPATQSRARAPLTCGHSSRGPNTPLGPTPVPHALSRSADPYEALHGLPGATWKLADRAAELLGHPSGSAARGGAALLQALRQAAEAEGHTYLPWATLAAGAGGGLPR